MTTAFATSTITTLATVLLKPVIANYLPAPLKGDAGDALTEWLSEHLGEQLGSRFGREQTMQEKLSSIIQCVFDRLNEKYEDKFSEFPAYVKDNGISISNRDDMTAQLKEWRKQKTAVTAISEWDIKDFVNEFFTEVTAQIEQDDTLKAHLATLRTEKCVTLLQEEWQQLKRQLENGASQQITRDDINKAESKLNELLEKFQEQLKENMQQELKNQAEIEGDDITIEDGIMQQNTVNSPVSSVGNVFKITGKNVKIKSVNQSNHTSGSGTE